MTSTIRAMRIKIIAAVIILFVAMLEETKYISKQIK